MLTCAIVASLARSSKFADRRYNPKAARDKLASLKQTGSVKAYNDLFLGTILEIPTISEEEQLDRYIRGLKEKVYIEVELREPSNLKEAMHIANRYNTISFTYTKCTLYILRPQGI